MAVPHRLESPFLVRPPRDLNANKSGGRGDPVSPSVLHLAVVYHRLESPVLLPRRGLYLINRETGEKPSVLRLASNLFLVYYHHTNPPLASRDVVSLGSVCRRLWFTTLAPLMNSRRVSSSQSLSSYSTLHHFPFYVTIFSTSCRFYFSSPEVARALLVLLLFR